MRTEFRLQKSYSRVFRVGEVNAGRPQCQYQTIQAAINAAVAAGYISNANNALIEVYDKGSPYAEDLTIRPGISIVGVTGNSGKRIGVNGNCAFSPTTLSRTENRVYIENIQFNGSNAAAVPSFLIGGTAGLELNFLNCGFDRTANDAQPAFRISNTSGNNCRVRLDSCASFFSDTVNASQVAFLISTTCRLAIVGSMSDYSTEGTTQSLFDLSATAQVQISCLPRNGNSPSFVSTGTMFRLHNNAQLTVMNTSLNCTDASFIDADSDNVVVRMINNFFLANPNNTKVMTASGAATGPSLSLSNCSFIGFGNNGGGGFIGENVYLNNGGPVSKKRMENVNDTAYAFVGSGGFNTIQEAVDFVKAWIVGGGQGVVEVDPGFYDEDIALPGGVKIVGRNGAGRQYASIGGSITFQYDNVGNNQSELVNIQLSNDTATPQIIMDSPNGGTLWLRGCNLNKQDGTAPIVSYATGNTAVLSAFDCEFIRFSGSAGALVFDLPEPDTTLIVVQSWIQGGSDMIVADGQGNLQFADNQYNSNRNVIGDSLQFNEFALTLPRGTNGSENIAYVGGVNGYNTIQQAVDALIVQQGLNGRKGVVYIAPGSYNEDVSLSGNIQIEGVSSDFANNDNFGFQNQNVFINGTVTWNSDGGTVKIVNLSINPPSGQEGLVLTGGGGGQAYFLNSTVFSNNDDGTSLVTCDITAFTFLLIKDSNFNKSGTTQINMMNFSTANIQVNPRFTNCVFNLDNPAGVMFHAGAVNFPSFQYCSVRGNMQTAFIFTNGQGPELFSCNVTVSAREIFYYAGNANVNVLGGSHLDPNYGEARMVARDGEQASALIALTSNVFPAGSGFEINGTNFIETTDFAIGVDEAATAINLAQAINNAADPGIGNDPNLVNKIYAVANGNNVELYAVVFSTAANSYTLNDINSAPATLTGFAGGVNGGGGTLVYGGITFGNTRTQNTLTYNTLPETVNPV